MHKLKWASEKVRKLIDKHLKNIGIYEKVASVSMLSEDFPKITGMYKGHKSQASAMEHAIRWQIKVNLENKDPGLYQQFKDRLDSIISTYQGNWVQMIKELEELKKAIEIGRPSDPRFTTLQAPFYEWIKHCASIEITQEIDALIVAEAKKICEFIKEVIGIANFWEKNDEVKALSDRIASRLRMGGLRTVIDNKDELTAQIMSICKSNYTELLRKIDDLA